jgi:hypothetical protein
VAVGTVRVAFHQELIEQQCMTCHTDHPGPALTRRATAIFSHALLRPATARQCQSCHTAPADPLHRQITGNCVQCHTQSAWKPATFAHDRYFVLDRAHNASCATCHVNNNYTRYTCYGCHAHSESSIARKHTEEGIRDFTNCVRCHRSASGDGDEGSDERSEAGRR